jgi:ABC-type multidrug transport system fused ATPase/permease subunit
MGTLAKIFELLNPSQRRSCLVLLGLMLIAMVLEMLGVGLIVPVLLVITDPVSGDRFPLLMSVMQWLGGDRTNQIAAVVCAMVLMYAIKASFLLVLAWFQARFVFSIEANLSGRLYQYYLCQPYEFHMKRNSALLVRNVTTGVGQFAGVVMSAAVLVSEALVLFGIALLLLYTEPLGTIFVGGSLAIACFGFYRLTRERILRWGIARQHHEGQRLKCLQQGLGSVRDVKLLGREQFFFASYEAHNTANASVGKLQSIITAMPRLWLEVLTVAGIAGLMLTMIYQGKPLDVIVPTLGLFAAAAFRLMPSANKVLNALQSLRYNLPVIDTLYAERDLLSEHVHTGVRNRLQFEKGLFLENVSYRYPGADSHVLSAVKLEITCGKIIGFVGPSGAGKSTLINLILGLISPSGGHVLSDGHDISKNLREWQACIGYVPQAVFLLDDTLKSNIAFGLSEEEIDESAMARAISGAQLSDFVASLPKGLMTRVGERGVRLSGGQCQRIGIARALYLDAPVLILDEASSSLDSKTEAAVMETVNNLRYNKTVLIIAHRLSTIAGCDEIYEVKAGGVRRLDENERDKLISEKKAKRA